MVAALGVLATLIGACGPTRTLLFVEDDQRLGPGDPDPTDGGGGGPADASIPSPDAAVELTLDPDAVFEWEQTLAGSGECGPGTYLGTYSCTTPEGIALEGVITFELVSGTSEAGLLITPGSITVVDPSSMDPATAEFWRAALVGPVDCATGALEAVSTQNQQLLALSLVFGGPFDIRLDGLLDTSEQTFAGEVRIVQQLSGIACDGSWTAKRMP